MLDKNGREIKTGDKVIISGGYFKSDNGFYEVVRSPGDPGWMGKEYSLRKLNKNGTRSKAKYNIAFWPLFVATNSDFKRLAAKAHNAQHAQIEVID